MAAYLLSAFSRVVDGMPVEAIVAVVERESQMLADDLAHGRMLPDGEAHSILSFCRFLEAARSGAKISSVALPMEDTAFYRKTTERLVKAGKLPGDAKEQFDDVFSRPALKLLSSAA